MTKRDRKRLKLSVTTASLIWMAAIGWAMFGQLNSDDMGNHNSSAIRDRMAECQGTFRERYDCKESIIVKSGQQTFNDMFLRFMLVIVPPLAANIWMGLYLRRHPVPLDVDFATTLHQHTDANWKARAQQHTHESMADDEEASAPPLRPAPGQHLLDVIAPAEDWKAKAQNHIKSSHHLGD